MENMNKVIKNLNDKKKRKERCDAKIDGLWNKVDRGGKNVKRYERYINPIIDDNFDGIDDENYNSASLGHEDQFG